MRGELKYASDNFDLRCVVRERMTKWIRDNYLSAFPTTWFAAAAEDTTAEGAGAQSSHLMTSR